jgi:tripartite-type tricarboxylate transporter receptor subunit TctC
MNLMKSWRAAAAAAALAGASAFAGATAASYPERPVRIVVPFPAGGGTDVIARVLGEKLGASLGKPFVVENRPGAGAMIGADQVAKAVPDGHTVLLGTSAELTISPGLYKDVPYDPDADFTPVALLGVSPVILVAHPSFKANSLADLIREAKQDPGAIAIGSGGQGAAPHLAAELLKRLTGIDVIIVPYRGGGPALADVVAGQVGATFSTIASVMPHLQSHSIKALAVITAERSILLPDVPSAAEQGVVDYEVVTWFGLFTPAKTSTEIVGVLRTAVDRALHDPDMTQRLIGLGIEPGSVEAGGDRLRQRIRTEVARWRLVIRDAGIKPD